MGSRDEATAAVPYCEMQSASDSSAVRALKATCEELQHSLGLCHAALKEQRNEIAAAHRDIASLQKEVEILKRQSIESERTLTTCQKNVSLLTALNGKEV